MSKTQLFLIAGAILLVAALLIFGEKTKSSIEESELAAASGVVEQGFSFDGRYANEKKGLDKAGAVELNLLEEQLEKETDSVKKMSILQSVNLFWIKKQNSFANAYIKDSLARLSGKSPILWPVAGQAWQHAAQMETDSSLQKDFYGRAITCLETSLELDPGNADTEADLLFAKIETATGPPMRTIFKLRDLADKNPDRLRPNFYMGQLSMKSTQYEKAIGRFETIIEHFPSFSEGHVGLAQAHYQNGDAAKAVSILESYRALTRNEEERARLDQIIQNISSE